MVRRFGGSSILVLAGLALGLGSLARAQERTAPPAGHVAWPSPPAEARAGDWLVLTGKLVVASCCSESKTSRFALLERVASVEGDVVHLDETAVVGDVTTKTKKQYSRKVTFELSKLFDTPAKPKLSDPTVETEKLALGGRDFDTRKITIHAVPGDAAPNSEAGTVYVLWLSPEVKGPGYVALRIRDRDAAGTEHTGDLSLAGFGTAQKTLWGKSAEDVLSHP